jgi:hypothetical protein
MQLTKVCLCISTDNIFVCLFYNKYLFMFIQSYLIEHQSDKRLQDRRIQENLWIAVESYIMNQVHDKVYSKICSKHQKENKLFIDRCRKLRMTLIPSLLGISKDYDCNYPLTIKELEKIGNGQSPVDKLYCLSDALDNIQTDVCTHYKSLLRIGGELSSPLYHISHVLL